MKDCETITEIRQTRRAISARFGNDPQRLIEHYITMQKEDKGLAKAMAMVQNDETLSTDEFRKQ